MMIFKTGLTLGKFAPFHRGHEYLIETALREVEKLIVLIYDSSLTRIPLSVRAEWIRRLYPRVEVLEGWGGPEESGRGREVEKKQEDYVLKALNGRKIDAFYSSEFYGKHMSLALKAKDRRVDEERRAVPVSGTLIRRNPHSFRHLMNPLVYRDHITRVVLVGAMSTGKSSLAEKLALAYETSWMPEYGREYWESRQVDRRLSLDDLERIVRVHQEREDELAASANRYLFVDTCAITTYLFSLDYHKTATEFVRDAANKDHRRYDLFFLCGDDIPYDDTWDRSGPQKRSDFQKQTVADLLERRIPFIPLMGSLNERAEKVGAVLRVFEKYANYFGRYMA
ncbi:MAG: AAA family ATPase [Deltaproteobacteria bacterium]|jgi:NadR type nicotinamide-nucleotide adenylyltransferase|nr:AAA family ATPase [Deltaproteobacteria bacterium]